MRRQPRVLVAEDEQKIANLVARGLTAQGFEVDIASDGLRALDLTLSGRHDVVILDLGLPFLNGRAVLEQAGTNGSGAVRPRIIVLSALADVEEKVQCLELGASDYMTKPFAFAELLARVKAQLRAETNGGPVEPRPRRLSGHNITLDLDRRTADAGRGKVPLANREFLLLRYLLEHLGEVCSREELLSAVWGYSFDPGTNVVNVYIGRLRAKLGPHAIETVRNGGYYVDAP